MPTSLGFSPDRLKDYSTAAGGTGPLLHGVLAARAGEMGAPQSYLSLSPEERASLDRYANFAELAKTSAGSPVRRGIDYVGGMGAMAATEMMKYAKPVQAAASSVYNKVTGNPSDAPFFGGKDTSDPSMANLTSAHYGFMEGMNADPDGTLKKTAEETLAETGGEPAKPEVVSYFAGILSLMHQYIGGGGQGANGGALGAGLNSLAGVLGNFVQQPGPASTGTELSNSTTGGVS